MIQEIKNISCSNIVKKLINTNLINNGFWGYVYKFTLNQDLKIAIKIQPLYNDKLYDPDIIDTRDIKLEIKLLKKLSLFCKKYDIFHFPLFYKSLICNNYQLIICKFYNSSFEKILKKKISFSHFKNIIHQIIISIFLFQKKTKCFHNDITINNILLLSTDNQTITYNFKYLDLTIKSFNFYVILSDFGNCIPLNKNNNNFVNIDILQLKHLLYNYISKFMQIFNFETLYNFCFNLDSTNFHSFFLNELKNNKIKFAHIRDLKLQEQKIQNNLKFNIYNYIYQHKYIFKLFETVNTITFNFDQSMLDYLDNLPTNINLCMDLISNDI